MKARRLEMKDIGVGKTKNIWLYITSPLLEINCYSVVGTNFQEGTAMFKECGGRGSLSVLRLLSTVSDRKVYDC